MNSSEATNTAHTRNPERGKGDRVDGRDKVTGKAKYAAEHTLPGMTYGVLVGSAIAKGSIRQMEVKAAQQAPGVLAVLTHLNAPKPPAFLIDANAKDKQPWPGLKIFYDNKIVSNGQPIALVVADTFERARYAASLIKVQYEKVNHETDFLKNKENSKLLKNAAEGETYQRGEANAYKKAEINIEAEYQIPIETHNPMELHAIIANWEADDKITVYDKTQGPKDTQGSIMQLYNLPEANVNVIAEFVGGAFGSALRVWPHEVAAIIAAKMLKRPVKLVLTRDQMFTMVGYRPQAYQRIGIGAGKDGSLTGITHEAVSITSSYEDFSESSIVNVSKSLYACPNVNTRYKLLPLDVNTPIWMRGPGEATGCFGLESALDELSYKLNIDPLALRLKNHADKDPENGKPFSSKYLKECYEIGAEKIGWKDRKPTPRSMQEDGMLVGYGMGSGVFYAMRWQASAIGTLRSDGILQLESAVSDMGPGTATAMTQVASTTLGYPAEMIKFKLGSTLLPPGPTQGGSATTSTLGSAIFDVCNDLKDKLKELALQYEGSPFKGMKVEDLLAENGQVVASADRSRSVKYTDVITQNNLPEISIKKSSSGSKELENYSSYSYSVHFVKVAVNPMTGVVSVKRVVTVGDAGKIISEKTARSQMVGGVVGGIGMALTEEALIDHRYGRYVNNNFADYHVPVNADIPNIETYFIDKPDFILNPIGAKGMGEIALIGLAAAVANAVFHATGIRIRELPITPDKLLG